MYNRYTPRSDGTYERCRMEDHIPKPKPKPVPPPQESIQPPECVPQKQEPVLPPPPQLRPHRTVHGKSKNHTISSQPTQPLSSFLKQLLPKDFDTADLMIVLLLLIMSGDCAEDQNTALLTLVLYLFL